MGLREQLDKLVLVAIIDRATVPALNRLALDCAHAALESLPCRCSFAYDGKVFLPACDRCRALAQLDKEEGK